jgi:hypothetical protein
MEQKLTSKLFHDNKRQLTCGFAQVGQTEKTSAFVLLSAAVRADRMLSANEQIINFFILYSADGSGRHDIESPTCAKPCSLHAIIK